VCRGGDGKPDDSHHPNERERPPRSVAWPRGRGAWIGVALSPAGDPLGWQVRSQIAQLSPCPGQVSGIGPGVELLKIKAADRICITE